MTPIFLKFTNQMSALRVRVTFARTLAPLLTLRQAVNALDGSTFNDCTISARFYDPERFENGLLDLT